jgi:RNA 2',3'-cyclic 3'-phosphodiesterase
MTNRLFIALEIPSDILGKIIFLRDSVYGMDNRIKWESGEKLHITLKFLGDTDTGLTNKISSIMSEVISRHRKVELEFDKFGMFYRDKKPSILWLGLKKNLALKELFLEFEKEIFTLGFKKENREFKPHLTILRIKGNEDINKLNALVSEPELALNFTADKIILFKSQLMPSGSKYEIVNSFLLK